MKIFKLLSLVLCTLLFSQCKTTSPTAPSGPAPLLSDVLNVLDTTEIKFFAYADSTSGDAKKAIMLTTNWLKTQPDVQSATVLDSLYINITLKSGLETIFHIDQIGPDSLSIFRGGGGSVSSKNPVLSRSDVLSKNAKNAIANKKVLIYSAAHDQFYKPGELEATAAIFSGSSLGLNVTLLKNQQCTYNMVENFKDYGLVIIDSHGNPRLFEIGSKVNLLRPFPKTAAEEKPIFELQLGPGSYDKFITHQLLLGHWVRINIEVPLWYKSFTVGGIFDVFLTTSFIDALPSMPNTVLFGSMCYSGYGVQDRNFLDLYNYLVTPMKTAWMDKNPISYYCFAFDNGASESVDNIFAKAMEDSLAHRLVVNTDSTGIGHLHSDGTEYSDPTGFFSLLKLKHFGADDYSYQKCGDSLLDSRDGQKYATICIGKQVWMAQNLNYNALGSITYNGDPANGNLYGRFYDFNTLTQGAAATNLNPSGIQGVCPKGWHVPSQPEFQTLITFLGIANVGGTMKSSSSLWTSPNVGATNSSGFSALPGGYMVLDKNGNPSFNFINTHAYFWSASLGAPNYYQIYVLTNSDADLAAPGATDKYSISCRCVKD